MVKCWKIVGWLAVAGFIKNVVKNVARDLLFVFQSVLVAPIIPCAANSIEHISSFVCTAVVVVVAGCKSVCVCVSTKLDPLDWWQSLTFIAALQLQHRRRSIETYHVVFSWWWIYWGSGEPATTGPRIEFVTLESIAGTTFSAIFLSSGVVGWQTKRPKRSGQSFFPCHLL